MTDTRRREDDLLDTISALYAERKALKLRIEMAVTQIRLFQLREYDARLETIEELLGE